jgi:hypothetical protein
LSGALFGYLVLEVPHAVAVSEFFVQSATLEDKQS